MAIDKGIWTWSGFPGAPGYSILYATPGAGISGDVQAFFTAVRTELPSSVSITGPTGGDSIDPVTGTLTGTWSGGTGGTINGMSAAVYAGPAGAVVTWLTDGIANGRRVRGRTFLVPLSSSAYQTDGSLLAGSLTAIQSAANALVSSAAGNLLVWHRPVGGVGGSAHAVTGAKVSDRVAVLRSRRG